MTPEESSDVKLISEECHLCHARMMYSRSDPFFYDFEGHRICRKCWHTFGPVNPEEGIAGR